MDGDRKSQIMLCAFCLGALGQTSKDFSVAKDNGYFSGPVLPDYLSGIYHHNDFHLLETFFSGFQGIMICFYQWDTNSPFQTTLLSFHPLHT